MFVINYSKNMNICYEKLNGCNIKKKTDILYIKKRDLLLIYQLVKYLKFQKI